MGWRGALRSGIAISNALHRDSVRRQKIDAKNEMIEDAAEAVAEWQNAIHDLTTLHVDQIKKIDWHGRAQKPAPNLPQFDNKTSSNAKLALERHAPSLVDLFFFGTRMRRLWLESQLKNARHVEVRRHQKQTAQYEKKYQTWKNNTDFAKLVVMGNLKTIKRVIEANTNLWHDERMGTSIEYLFYNEIIHAFPSVFTDDVVPNFRRKQLKSGMLSETDMPKSQFNKIYQDYVASVALKVAGDLFCLLPANQVFVTCKVKMVNRQSGHMELTPILSVRFMRSTFDTLNVTNVDPSECLENFVYEMKYSNTKGFSAITPLDPTATDAATTAQHMPQQYAIAI